MHLTGERPEVRSHPLAAAHDQERGLTTAEALEPAAFDACMRPLEPFEEAPILAVAVSGGPDSLALTLLANRWARARGGRVVGLTVDHGLREGSADEARRTGRWLAARRIEHRILAWQGDKPKTGLQKHAREARYALLSDWCRDAGCLHLLTAHHRQDQAETVAIRRARQSGAAGLAAMASVRELDGFRLLRPLLGIDRARLIATLRARGQPWIEDPSNDDPAFTRVRFRRSGLDVAALAGEAALRSRERHESDRRAAAALARLAVVDPAGFVTLDAEGFTALTADLAREILSRVLMTVGGGVYPPRGRSLRRLLDHLRATPERGRTLASCRLRSRGAGWMVCREEASSETLRLSAGKRRRWDDRFDVLAGPACPDLTLRALGDDAGRVERVLIQKEKSRRLPAVVERTLPSFWMEDVPVCVPHLGLFAPAMAPDRLEVRFRPKVPLANGPFPPHMTR